MRTKKLIISLAITLVMIFVADNIIGYLLREYYYSQKNGQLYNTTYALDSVKTDMVVFGSSRAERHYNTKILSDSTNLSCYNAGRDGMSVIYYYALLKAILKRHKPKVIVLEVAKGELYNGDASYDRLSILLPYYHSHDELKPIINEKSKFEKIKMISKIYPYNSLFFSIVVNQKQGTNATNNGFTPAYGNKVKLVPDTLHRLKNKTKTALDQRLLRYLELFIKETTDNNIKLYVVVSPVHRIFPDDRVVKTINELNKKYNFTFFDFTIDKELSYKPELFFDYTHLNSKGADAFSAKIASYIKADALNEKKSIPIAAKSNN